MALNNQEQQTQNSEKNKKTVFNKKKWREQKYSNKTKVIQWENNKQNKALRQYNKELKKSGFNIQLNKRYEQKSQKSSSSIKKAQSQYEKLQKEKQEKKNERKKVQKQREEAIKAYKEKKAMKFRKLSQKTRKGQPVMRGRIELLLEKIEKQYGKHENLFLKS